MVPPIRYRQVEPLLHGGPAGPYLGEEVFQCLKVCLPHSLDVPG